MTHRNVWLTDRYGVQTDVATTTRLGELLDSIAADDSDDEHQSISITDEDGWNLEYDPSSVTFENVEVGGEVVGRIRGATRAEELAIAAAFLVDDLAAVRAYAWS